MSYTMTYDVSHKVGRGGHAKAFFRHIARDVDQAAGFSFPQKNPNIAVERTRLNSTFVNDGNGGFRRPESIDGRPPSDEFDDYLRRRLSTVSKSLRKDAVLIRGVVLQLDPKWFDQHNPGWREEGLNADAAKYTRAVVQWAQTEFGQRNIVGMSMHLDEVNPGLQLMMTPVTSDGRLAQKEFFKGPADLKRQHRDVRNAVAAEGYDVEYRVTERSKEHLSSSEFQARAIQLHRTATELEFERDISTRMKREMAERAIRLDEEERLVAEREKRATARENEVLQSRAMSAQQSEAVRKAWKHARELHESAQNAVAAVESDRERISQLAARLSAVPPFFERWLDRTKAGGHPLRARYEADVNRMRSELGIEKEFLTIPTDKEAGGLEL